MKTTIGVPLSLFLIYTTYDNLDLILEEIEAPQCCHCGAFFATVSTFEFCHKSVENIISSSYHPLFLIGIVRVRCTSDMMGLCFNATYALTLNHEPFLSLTEHNSPVFLSNTYTVFFISSSVRNSNFTVYSSCLFVS